MTPRPPSRQSAAAPAPAPPAAPPLSPQPRELAWLAAASGPLQGETGPGVAVRWLFRSSTVAVTRWRCVEPDPQPRGPKHQLWHGIGFLHGGTFRMRDASTAGVADSTRLLFFNPGAPYETSHPCGCGDRGGSLIVREDVARSLVRPWDPATADGAAERLFARGLAPGEPRLQMELSRLLRDIERTPSGDLDALRFEEAVLALAGRAVSRLMQSRSGARRLRDGAAEASPPSAGAGRERIVAVQELLWRNLSAPPPLADLAAAVGISTFQLCRQFRAATGSTVHRYLTRLRLGQALELLEGGVEDLSGLAFDLGFSSHSHFTSAFRSEFGSTPSAFRGAIARAPAQLRRRAARSR